MEASSIAIIITIAVIIMYATDIVPISITALISCLAMGIFGAASYKTVFAGFSNDVTMMVAGMMVVGDTLFATGAAEYLGNWLIKAFGKTEKTFIVVTILVTATLSAFLSNSATVAMMMPIMASAVAASKGTLTKKYTYMPIGFAGIAGGGATLIGSTPQLIAQGLLLDAGADLVGFFDYSIFGLVQLAVLLIYFVTIGYSLSKKVFDFDEVPDAAIQRETSITEDSEQVNKLTPHMIISILILVGCVALFIAQVWSYGIISMVGAVLCVITRCVSVKDVYRTLDWGTIIVVAGGLGFASALDESGAGVVIANKLVGLLGTDASPYLILAALGLLATIFGNIMSHSATSAILIPITLFMAPNLGISPKIMAMTIVIFCSKSFATPISTPPNTLTLVAGYRFKDYLKVGGLLNIISYFVGVAMLPLLFRM